MIKHSSASKSAARESRCEAKGITSPLYLFFISAACVWICASSMAGPVHSMRHMESHRSDEFFQLAGVSQWLKANKPENGEVPHPIELIHGGDGSYQNGDYIEAIVGYELFLRAFSQTTASEPLFALVRDKLSAVYTLLGEKRLADDIIEVNGQRVSFGTRSRVLQQERRDGKCQLHLTSANVYTVAKIISQRSGKMVATVWLVPPRESWQGAALQLNLPAGVYQIVCAQEVRRNSRGEYSALVYRKLRSPLSLSDLPEEKMTRISIDNEAFVESTGSTFGSFESLKRSEQPHGELIRRSLGPHAPDARDVDPPPLPDFMQAELENPDTPDSRKAQLKLLASSYEQWAKDRSFEVSKPRGQAVAIASPQAPKKLLDVMREEVAALDRILSSGKLSDENIRRADFYHRHLVSYAEWLQDRTD
jgi:hypothetical protein